MRSSSTLIRSSRAIGSIVRSPAGATLGRIEDLVIEPDSGLVAYAVLSFGGISGIKDRWLPVPWGAFTICLEEDALAQERYTFVLDVDSERLNAAPGFGQDESPDRRDLAQVYDYYGYRPYWEA